MANKVMHFEVNGKDAERSQRFYSSLFGWKIDASNPMNYGLVSEADGGIAGGISASPGGPMVTFYVGVPDLAKALKRAGELGGKTTLEPHQVPNGPKIAMFSDP